MASTRSRAEKRRAAPSASAETPKQALTALARHSARIQVAAFTAFAKTVSGWVQSADRLVETVGDELLRRIEGESDSPGPIARVAAATNVHLRDLTTLPRAAADHFETRLAPVSIHN